MLLWSWLWQYQPCPHRGDHCFSFVPLHLPIHPAPFIEFDKSAAPSPPASPSHSSQRKSSQYMSAFAQPPPTLNYISHSCSVTSSTPPCPRTYCFPPRACGGSTIPSGLDDHCLTEAKAVAPCSPVSYFLGPRYLSCTSLTKNTTSPVVIGTPPFFSSPTVCFTRFSPKSNDSTTSSLEHAFEAGQDSWNALSLGQLVDVVFVPNPHELTLDSVVSALRYLFMMVRVIPNRLRSVYAHDGLRIKA